VPHILQRVAVCCSMLGVGTSHLDVLFHSCILSVCVCTCIFVCVCVCVCGRCLKYKYSLPLMYNECVCAFVCGFACVCMCMCADAGLHLAYTYSDICNYLFTYTLTHTQAQMSFSSKRFSRLL